MARIVMSTFGSTGDLNPFVAVALCLREQGHDVRFAVEENFRPAVEAQGFTVDLLTGNNAAALRPYARQAFDAARPLLSLKLLMRHYILPTLPAKIAELRAACRGADLLVANATQFAASFAAELDHLRWASVILTPATLPSATLAPQPSHIQLPAALQRTANRTAWAIGGLAIRRIVDAPINTLRAGYGLPPRHDWFWTGNLSPTFTALAISPAFLSPPSDWPADVHVTGFCFWDGADELAPEIAAFFGDERPVVAVTAGSYAPEAIDIYSAFFRTSIAAIRACGAKALLIGAPPELQGKDVLVVGKVPYSQVFPRCRTVILHGGIGTIAQAFRAGIPSLVVPGGVDQIFNAALAERDGAGIWLERKRYTTERARVALSRLLDGSTFHSRLQAISTQVQQEHGAQRLARQLAGLLSREPE